MRVDVQPAEYFRLLGYPRDAEPSGRACELAESAREWYAAHGRPWTFTREVDRLALREDTVVVEDVAFSSRRLHQSLREAEANSVILAAVSAGPEAEEEAQKLWRDEKPDEYFFLEVFASAVVEHLLTATGAKLCASAEAQGLAVLPHYSPGYSGWDIAEQDRLKGLFGQLPGRLEVLDSGALRPKKSQLAVFGLTRHPAFLGRLTDMLPCENCSYGPCQYRRAPYRRDRPGLPELPSATPRQYSTNPKALKRWAAERLVIVAGDDGGFDARFRYDGTTCKNMGQPLAFDYSVKLGPRERGFPILEQRCSPAPGDKGFTHMCQYLADAGSLMDAIAREKPLLGRPLRDALQWSRLSAPAGCYCDSASREHKWGLVLETIHYALHEKNSTRSN
jgi:hypothetical protein